MSISRRRTLLSGSGEEPCSLLNTNIGFEDGTYSNEFRLSYANADSAVVSIQTSIVRSGTYAMKSSWSTKGAGSFNRCEVLPRFLGTHEGFDFDVEYWLGMSIYLKDITTNITDWLVLSQLNGVPQDWDNGVGEQPWSLTVRKANYGLAPAYDALMMDCQVIPDVYAPPTNVEAPWYIPVPENEWFDIVMHFKISITSAGFIALYYNSDLVLSQSGANSYANDMTGLAREPWTNWQFGGYKPSVSTVLREVYYDEIRVADSSGSYSCVAPDSSASYGPELLSAMAEPAWTPNPNWSIAASVASCAAGEGTLEDTNFPDISPGNTYKLEYTVSNYSSGTLFTGNGSLFGSQSIQPIDGTHSYEFTSVSSSRFYLYSNLFVGDIDSISIKQVLS